MLNGVFVLLDLCGNLIIYSVFNWNLNFVVPVVFSFIFMHHCRETFIFMLFIQTLVMLQVFRSVHA